MRGIKAVLLAAGLSAALTGCLFTDGPDVKVAAAPDEDPFARLQRPGCYTVDLFDEPEFAGTAGLPPEYARFLGEWGNGVWNGDWCHELIVTAVTADGRVEMLDLHGPHENYGIATAFKRTGRITDDGRLRFAHGTERREYRFVDGRLHGLREDGVRSLEIVLTQMGVVPIPLPRPAGLAVRAARG
ncbi:MAG: hypothetical protein ACFBSD_01345 [Paracoccaceae bacterium]